MMISPNCYVDELSDKTYKELLEAREILLKSLYLFEKGEAKKGDVLVCPSPEVMYQMNLEYLGELCKLISKKYNEEYIWNKKESK